MMIRGYQWRQFVAILGTVWRSSCWEPDTAGV